VAPAQSNAGHIPVVQRSSVLDALMLLATRVVLNLDVASLAALVKEWKQIRSTKVKAAIKAAKSKGGKGGGGGKRHVTSAPVAELDGNTMTTVLAHTQVAPVGVAVDALTKSAKEIVDKSSNEERGKLIVEVGKVRSLIDSIDAVGLPPAHAEAAKAHFYRRVNAVSPFYAQQPNMNLLEGDKTRTCSITSLAMCLEALGKTAAADYTGPSVGKVAEVYGGKVTSAKDDQASGLTGLRLPDFLQLVAIGKCTGPDGDVEKGMREAWDRIKNIAFLRSMATDFGVPGATGSMSTQHATEKNALRKTAEDLHTERVTLAQKEAELAKLKAAGEDAKKQGRLDREIKGLQDSMSKRDLSPASLDELVTVEAFKEQVLATIKPELDRGRQVVNLMTNHFVRMESVTEEGMVADDPGGSQRKDRPVSWEEGRAMAFFHRYLILG